jgi:hypothetical protein
MPQRGTSKDPELNILYFKIEASSVMNDFPYLAIRGSAVIQIYTKIISTSESSASTVLMEAITDEKPRDWEWIERCHRDASKHQTLMLPKYKMEAPAPTPAPAGLKPQ